MEKQPTERRSECPCCGSSDLSAPVEPHIELEFPMLPVCVDTPRSEDKWAPFTICLCNECGLILLRDVVDPQVLYEIFHSDGLGPTWAAHYDAFAELIKAHHKSGKLLEIGGGQGKLIERLLAHYKTGVEVVDPVYEGPSENVTVHDMLLTPETAKQFKEEYDCVISSHTLEHFLEYNVYFQAAWTVLKPGGLLCTSVPNMEHSFSQGYGNQLNFEHPAICLNLHWTYLHYKNGFAIKEIRFFRDHSYQVVAEKIMEPIPFKLEMKPYSEKILKKYEQSIQNRIETIKRLATDDKENWLFGASNLSQPLFMYGLDEKYFAGVMDNSPPKHNKRLYGTGLVCRKPEDVVGKKPVRVFLNLAHYNDEVNEQLKGLDPDVECIFL